MNIKNRLQKLESQNRIGAAFCSCPNPYRKILPPSEDGTQPENTGCFNCGKPLAIRPGEPIVVLVPTADGRGAMEL